MVFHSGLTVVKASLWIRPFAKRISRQNVWKEQPGCLRVGNNNPNYRKKKKGRGRNSERTRGMERAEEEMNNLFTAYSVRLRRDSHSAHRELAVLSEGKVKLLNKDIMTMIM